jgi:fatty acid desaturase
MISVCFVAAWTLGPRLSLPYQRMLYLVVYPFLVSLPATGLWVLGHEAGHGSFSRNRIVANAVGFFAHSVLLSPYFAWRSTHARHHVYANHIHKVG